ncbi:Kazal-type serine protease inhibitor family protein [Desulfatitalea alkaliphila]|uniref:Kazal-like domain-containing protein n=1 Tax=Desulfatitalea alkaliphila TaxID=2929485 RepID=A0AA41UIW0_9BACT|nr:Kazal-type serine protease inhibitor domain-containing protein [Desulfatitalea alkaliphila]MCJ8499947.1 hypothetical protein [Desulfatitalea alkaliphila]
MFLRTVSAAIVVLLVCACQPADEFQLEELFRLQYQETKINKGENIRIRFNAVLSDRRCPIEQNCLVPGTAELQLVFWKGARRESFVLQAGAGIQIHPVAGYTVVLHDLFPPYSLRNPPGKKDYVAVLQVLQGTDSCIDNTDCDTRDAFCRKAPGECAAVGQCAPRPEICPHVWDPVCGCDGRTYGNACVAASNGVNVDYKGECAPQYCWHNDQCGAEAYCFFRECALETGVCQPRPQVSDCPRLWEPVCGCDGETYANRCIAAARGASIDYPGECKNRSR